MAEREASVPESGRGSEGAGTAASGASGVIRNQNVVYTLPFDAASLGQVLTPVVDRVEAQTTEPQVLVVTPDADTALTAARVTVQLAGERALRVLPATSTARAVRRLAPVLEPGRQFLARLGFDVRQHRSNLPCDAG